MVSLGATGSSRARIAWVWPEVRPWAGSRCCANTTALPRSIRPADRKAKTSGSSRTTTSASPSSQSAVRWVQVRAAAISPAAQPATVPVRIAGPSQPAGAAGSASPTSTIVAHSRACACAHCRACARSSSTTRSPGTRARSSSTPSSTTNRTYIRPLTVSGGPADQDHVLSARRSIHVFRLDGRGASSGWTWFPTGWCGAGPRLWLPGATSNDPVGSCPRREDSERHSRVSRLCETVGGPRRPLLLPSRPCERTRRWYP